MERLTVKQIIQTEHECVARQQCDRNCAKCDLVMDAKDILSAYEHVLELLNAEEQGLLLRLPCKVGDTVYALDEVMEVDVVHEINFGRTSNGDLRLLFLCEMGVSFYDNDVGKTVFLSREEAEAALKEG